jgi:hypothetical protein
MQIRRLSSVSFFGHSQRSVVLNAQRNAHQRLGFQAQPNRHGSVRGKMMTTDRRSMMMMLTRIGSTISASEGTLAGDILWLGASAFVFSVVIGIVG